MDKKHSSIFVIKDKAKFLAFVEESYYPTPRHGVFNLTPQRMSEQHLAKILTEIEDVHMYHFGFEKLLIDPNSKDEKNKIVARVVVSDNIFSLVVEELPLEAK